jgi:hypothetical protein
MDKSLNFKIMKIRYKNKRNRLIQNVQVIIFMDVSNVTWVYIKVFSFTFDNFNRVHNESMHL